MHSRSTSTSQSRGFARFPEPLRQGTKQPLQCMLVLTGMPTHRIAVAAAVALAAAPSTPTAVAGAQQARSSAVMSDSIRPYSRVTAVRELPSGSVIVSDAGQSRVELLSPSLQRMVPVTSRGEGPTEFRSADFLLAAPGNATQVVDFEGVALLEIDPSGAAVRKFPVRKLTSGTRTLSPEIGARDNAGRYYFTGIRPNATPGAARDSAPLLRWTPTADAIDTLTWIRIPVAGLRRSAADSSAMLNARPDPFEWRDMWTVAPNGRLAVVRGDDYHIDLYEDARRVVSGPRVQAPRELVSAADAARLHADSISITTPTGTRTVSNATGALLSTHKAYVVTDAPPRVDRDGRIWVERSRASGTDLVTYDVFDATANPVLTVALRNNARTVGFGEGTVYVTHPNESGRYKISRGQLPGR